jgi:hypothetical protein
MEGNGIGQHSESEDDNATYQILRKEEWTGVPNPVAIKEDL